MVTQARDQLESNETMSEIREVFDGSCDLIPIKVVKKECRRLADDFIPELIEALASQMNPQVSNRFMFEFNIISLFLNHLLIIGCLFNCWTL